MEDAMSQLHAIRRRVAPPEIDWQFRGHRT